MTGRRGRPRAGLRLYWLEFAEGFMAIKFENTSGPQTKPAEKRPVAVEDKKKAAPAEPEDDKAAAKAKKPRAGFKKK